MIRVWQVSEIITHEKRVGSARATVVWFVMAIAYASYCLYAGLAPAFRHKYIIQSDGRQILSWMERFVDPALFQNDLIADYYRSVSPAGYIFTYWSAAKMGIDPIQFSKVLPIFLGLLTTALCFAVCFRLLKVPAAACISTILLNQALWTDDSLVSATPRAFQFALFLAFLLFLIRRSFWLSTVMIALQSLFYPTIMMVSLIVLLLRLITWRKWRPAFSRSRRDYAAFAAAFVVALVITVPFMQRSAKYGQTVTATQARALPSALAGKRLTFMDHGFWKYWLTDGQTGLYARRTLPPPLLFTGFLLPALFLYPRRFPLVKSIDREVLLLAITVCASLLLFFAAHAALFKLYLPSRYTLHVFPMVLSISAALTLIVLIDTAFKVAERSEAALAGVTKLTAVGLVALALMAYPSFLKRFPTRSWTFGKSPGLYEFLSRQPKDALIATLSGDANSIPSFANRSVLTGSHFANPYQPDYYLQLNGRYVDLLHAQYTPDPAELKAFIEKYGVDLIIVERDAFDPDYLSRHEVIRRFKLEVAEIKRRLEGGRAPALTKLIDGCVVFESRRAVVLRADCVAESAR